MTTQALGLCLFNLIGTLLLVVINAWQILFGLVPLAFAYFYVARWVHTPTPSLSSPSGSTQSRQLRHGQANPFPNPKHATAKFSTVQRTPSPDNSEQYLAHLPPLPSMNPLLRAIPPPSQRAIPRLVSRAPSPPPRCEPPTALALKQPTQASTPQTHKPQPQAHPSPLGCVA
jgi:hypothetical protein